MTASLKLLLFRILVPLLFFGSAFALPVYHLESDVSNFLTTVSVLFAILLGFFIATATTNYLNFQTSLADEGTALIMLYNFGAIVRPSAKEQLADAIDAYVIATLDFRLTDYVQKTEQECETVFALVDGLEPEDAQLRRTAALDGMNDAKANFLRARTVINAAARRVTRATHWAVIVLLGVILIALVYSLRTGDLFSGLVAGTLTATLYLILLLLYELDGNVFLEEQLAFEDVQDIFSAIHRPAYYPKYALDLGLATPSSSTYRLGTYIDFPRTTAKKFSVVRSAT